MKCLKCGNQIPATDKYCGYCGEPTGSLTMQQPMSLIKRLPKWLLSIMIAGVFVVAIVIFLLVSLILNDNSYIGNYYGEEEMLLNEPGVVAYSTYVTTVVPAIDGVINQGEWANPALRLQLNRTEDRMKWRQQGEALFYCMNDQDNLYVALTISSSNPGAISPDKQGAKFFAEIVFDGDNDGIPELNDDMKTIGSRYETLFSSKEQYFDDQYVDDRGYGRSDKTQNGEGAHKYLKDSGTWIFECRVPLHSGDPYDLNELAGRTIGIRWEMFGYRTVRWYDIWKRFAGYRGDYSIAHVLWPNQYSGGRWATVTSPPCRSLVLAPAPSSGESSR